MLHVNNNSQNTTSARNVRHSISSGCLASVTVFSDEIRKRENKLVLNCKRNKRTRWSGMGTEMVAFFETLVSPVSGDSGLKWRMLKTPQLRPP